jgi:isopenicillin-N N-acyltransferase-like protein
MDLEGARMTTQHVRVEGTSYQRGRQAAARVRLSVQAYQQTFAHFAGWDWATVRREAARFEAPIGTFRPAYLEEMRGIADGATVTEALKVLQAWLAQGNPCQVPHERLDITL